MTYQYDEQTETKYYDSTMVLEFRQLENADSTKEDMRIFILYDDEEDLIYMYGSRKSEDYPDYVNFIKTVDSEKHAYDFLNIMMGLDTGCLINTSVYYMSDLTDYSDFDDFDRNAAKEAEISGYNKEIMTPKKFKKYMSVLF